jgi:hypothetical protein
MLVAVSTGAILVYVGAAALLAIAHGGPPWQVSLFGPDDPWIFHPLKALLAISGLVILGFVPGLVWAGGLFGRRLSLVSLAAGSLLLNAALLVSSTTLLKLLGFELSRTIMLADVVALMLLGAIVFWRRLERLEIDHDTRQWGAVTLVGCLAVGAMVIVFRHPVFADYDRYWPIELAQSVEPWVGDGAGIGREYVGWSEVGGALRPLSPDASILYHNPSPEPQRMTLRFFVSYFGPTLGVYHDGRLVASVANPQARIEFDLPGHQWPIADKIAVSEEILLAPGKNVITFELTGDKRRAYFCDASGLNEAETLERLQHCFVLGRFNDIVEPLEPIFIGKGLIGDLFPVANGKYAMINPPLLYYWYAFAYSLLDEPLATIYLLEFFGFLLLFVVLLQTVQIDKPAQPIHYGVILAALFAYVYATISLPHFHTASGMYLLLVFGACHFMLSGQLVLAALFATGIVMLRYDGIILVGSLVISHWLVMRDWRYCLRFGVMFGFPVATLFALFLVIVWLDGGLEFWRAVLEERGSLLGTGQLDARIVMTHVLRHAVWVLVGSCMLPLTFFFVKRDDVIARFYRLIAICQFAFLLTIEPIRPYYLGPIVFATAVVAARVLAAIPAGRRRTVAHATFALLAGASILLMKTYLAVYVDAGSGATLVMLEPR